MKQRLTRSRDDVIIAGVAGGMAEYFGVDPVIVRLVFVLLLVSSGGTFGLVYVALLVIMPEEQEAGRAVRQAPPPPPPGPPVAGGDVPTASPGSLEASDWHPAAPESDAWQSAGADPTGGVPGGESPQIGSSAADADEVEPQAEDTTGTGPRSDPDAWQSRVERSVDRATNDVEGSSAPQQGPPDSPPDRRAQFGLLLIIAGALLLFGINIDLDFSWMGPLLIVGIGVYLLMKRGRVS